MADVAELLAADPFEAVAAKTRARYPQQERLIGLGPYVARELVANVLSGVKSAATLPGDVYSGQVDPNSPEAFSRGMGLAGMMVGTPGTPTGALGSNLPSRFAKLSGPLSDAEYSVAHRELQQMKATVASLGPMREKLIELGATPEQMSTMNPAQAYQFIKEKSPGGMGQVNPGWQDRNQAFLDEIRGLQDQLTAHWQGGKNKL